MPATLCGLGVSMAFDAKLNIKTMLMVLGIAGAFWTLFSVLLGVDLGRLISFSFEAKTVMSSFDSLMQGFAVALEPMTLMLWVLRLLGWYLSGRIAGHWTGADDCIIASINI
ncbi:hypothetical protein [Polynucleobacter necessarius]|uniref:hypothetical protein n=1 Tax=Polynucleobacter necessarius TaxID=576610 RepID=UPI001E2A5329